MCEGWHDQPIGVAKCVFVAALIVEIIQTQKMIWLVPVNAMRKHSENGHGSLF